MTTMDEFALIESRLAWLEAHLRAQPVSDEDLPMASAIEALSCARALIVELSSIGRGQQSSSVATPG